MSDAPLVAIHGGGDLGSGAALRLTRAGFRVLVAERAQPTVVRRTVAFAEAIHEGQVDVEDLIGRRISNVAEAEAVWHAGDIAVAIDPDLTLSLALDPALVVDARMAKVRAEPTPALGPITIGLGPGFVAPVDCAAVVETNRGPNLGRVIWDGSAEPNTGKPALVEGKGAERVLRAVRAGTLRAVHNIGDTVRRDDVIAEVDGEPIRAPFAGLVRGLVRSGLEVDANMKVGDLDPRLQPELCYQVSDKALAVAGGVLEATLMLLNRRGLRWQSPAAIK